MSIAFRKKDYHYDGDDDDDMEKGEDDVLEEEDFYNENPEPLEWTLELYNELRNFCKNENLEILDRSDHFCFADFLYSMDVRNVY